MGTIGYVPAGEVVVAVVEKLSVNVSPLTAPVMVPVKVGLGKLLGGE